jgi:hypothetical protein
MILFIWKQNTVKWVCIVLVEVYVICGWGSVVDPLHFDADPDADPYHTDPDPDSSYNPVRIRILIFILCWSGFLFDADPTFHPDADPDPNPNFQIVLK